MNVDDIKAVAVVGAGLIGQSASAEFALGGYRVQLNSRSAESLQRGIEGIGQIFRRLVDLDLATQDAVEAASFKIHAHRDLGECADGAQLVYEAVYEDLELKQAILGNLDRLCAAGTILASGTSTLSVNDLASATHRPDKVIAANYSNPAYLVPLAEVMRGDFTSDETVAAFCDVLRRIGKKPVVIQRDVPGFVANRLQGALLREALSLVERGVVSAEDVDTIIKSSFGRRWAVAGVFEVFELAGWDLIADSASYLLPQLESSPDVPAVLREMVEQKRLGTKTGEGFYKWTPESSQALQDRIAHALVQTEKWSRTIR